MTQVVNELVVFVEEESAKIMLVRGLLPKLVPEHVKVCCVPFEGKQDLDKRVGFKLKAWLNPSAVFVILRDKDSSNCILTKQKLREICDAAGRPQALIRIACHELESWYLGDLLAVETGLGIKGIAKKQGNQKFRSPDNLANAKQELKKLTKNQYQPVGGSRLIGPHLNPNSNKSHSFQVFVAGINKVLTNLSKN
jgi:hypothetical protein